MRGSQVSFGTYRRVAAVSVALGVIGGLTAGPALAAPSPSPSTGVVYPPLGISASAECQFPSNNVPSMPWSLQKVVLEQLWAPAAPDKDKDKDKTPVPITGTGVNVAVIDTGVDVANPQLRGKVVDTPSSLVDKSNNQPVPGTSVNDQVGHGTKVAGIIAARKVAGIGFSGLAPDATIVTYRQNDSQGNGDVFSLVKAIKDAVARGVGVINISQDVRATEAGGNFPGRAELEAALKEAENRNVVVVASSGNDGLEADTYPAAIETVLAVGASDRNNERATFSQYGEFVDVVAPGVEMLSTVPGGGHCVDNGTSFSAPYVAGVAALLKQKYPLWTARQIRIRIMQTAQRVERKNNRFIGWGVVDPVKAVTSDAPPSTGLEPVEDAPLNLAGTAKLEAQPLGLAETQQDRDARTATYTLGVGGLLVGGLAGGAVVLRDRRRRVED
ncbi:type VII secretion-associated serine protease mycosin [Kitasatospora sp. NPDC101801]|uniref:type VII secretion-associated serine protease mycosin n=1 Tax=Kitasatospora sp. NPDC101801 TaxID=3364103 RepID=UPI00381C78D6